MTNCLKISLSFLLIILSFSLLPSATMADSGHLIVNEIYYDTAGDKGVEKTNEWVELYNPTSEAINLKNWTITDSSTTTPRVINLDYIIGSKSFAVITKDTSTWAYWSLPDKALKIELGLIIGNGLNNDGGDKVILKNSSGDPVDEINYGGGGSYDLSDVAEGHSLERSPVGGGEFVDQPTPTPGIGLPSKTILTLGVITGQSIEINWTKNSDEDFKDYKIFRSPDNKAWTEVNLISSNDILSYKVESLDSGVKYYFKIRVENQENGFWDSNIVSALTKKVYSSAILVNELFPHPSNGTDNEFIELYNFSSGPIDLSGWILKDGVGSLTTYSIPEKTVINLNSYLIFNKKDTHISLNDDSDFVNLFWPDGTLVSAIAVYKNADKDISWSRNVDNNWSFSTTATPGSANVFTSKQEEEQNLPIVLIENAKKQPKNSYVKVSGVVTAIPGLFGKRVMYLQDESGGIKIYFDKAIWPDLNIGDKVVILGKISTSSGEYQIRVYNSSDIVITDHNSQLQPAEHKINEINDLVGQLVKISGRVTKISGSSVWLDDSTGILRLYFYPTTGIKDLGLKVGDYITVIGILSKTSSGLRLLPRNKEDIKITKQSKEEIQAEKTDPIAQILGVEKAYAASDYRTDPQPAEVKKKTTYLWGGIVFIVGLLFLATLMIFARIREKDAKDNQFF